MDERIITLERGGYTRRLVGNSAEAVATRMEADGWQRVNSAGPVDREYVPATDAPEVELANEGLYEGKTYTELKEIAEERDISPGTSRESVLTALLAADAAYSLEDREGEMSKTEAGTSP